MAGKNTTALFALALLFFAGSAWADCGSYYEACGAGGCCPGLVCTDFDGVSRCTQPSGVCTIMPGVYEAPPPTPPPGGTPTTPGTLVSELESGGSPIFGGSEGLFKAGWFSDWKAAGLVGIAIVVMVISLAIMFGKAFNLPEVIAFGDTELRQALVSALLIFALIGLLGFLDAISYQAVDDMGLPVQCDASQPCYFTVAEDYLKSVETVANETAFNQLKIAVKQMAASSLGEQLQFNTYWVLFSGASTRLNAGLSMRAERASALFETSSSVISSIKAQQFFVEMAAKTIAPAFLLIGIVLRTFFFTRKLGGLLLAIAVSLFFVYPLCYAFSWYTLNIAVYGDRAFSTLDPNCPAECTAHFPVAFFIDPSGKTMQFDATQKLMLAGITEQNWDTGNVDADPDIEYPGLVACRDLSNAGLTTVPYSCGDCPDYCREIPFPSSIPSCDPESCKSELCNPGCKIMRQRTDCSLACDSGVTCPPGCRTETPIEDKCYFADENLGSTDVAPADFSVSCDGCEACPYWCRFLKEEASGGTTTYTQIFADNGACNIDECKPIEISQSGTCPLQCQYITKIGKSTLCGTECTLDGITCPEFCRIDGITDPIPGIYDEYDTTGVLEVCRDTGILQACNKCPSTCKISIGDPPQPAAGCAAFPTVTQVSENCLDCPEYCRYPDFSFISSHSNTPIYYADPISPKPASCAEGSNNGRVSCEGDSCKSICKAAEEPKTCREYSPSSGEPAGLCRTCPAEARVVLAYTSGGTTVTLLPDFANGFDAACTNTNCNAICKIELVIPAPAGCVISGGGGEIETMGLPEKQAQPLLSNRASGALLDAAPPDCSSCPMGCRVTGGGIDGLLDPACASLCTDCPASCKAAYGGQNFVCSEYMANGPDGHCGGTAPACVNFQSKQVCMANSCTWTPYRECTGEAGCSSHLDKTSCETDATLFCTWSAKSNAYYCFGPSQSVPCGSKNTQSGCLADPADGCIWAPKDSPQIPLSYRTDYTDPLDCKQCPENCRINEYIGQCGYPESGEPVVDCSYQSCPTICRVPKMETPPPDECQPYTEGDCEGCPIFCRRKNDKPLPYSLCFANGNCNSVNAETGKGCSDNCRLEDAPIRQCETCFNCPLDCNYYPAVRTDCNELCDDDALAGPVNIGPGDFIKKLPGADGEPDAKSVGTLLVVGMVLPLFCIVMVVAFIRVLSPVFGGDMDIPGLGRII